MSKKKNTYDTLRESFRCGLHEIERNQDLISAIEGNAFKHSEDKFEYYFFRHNARANSGQSGVLCYEHLTGLKTEDNQPISMERVSNQAADANIALEMDSLILANILAHRDPESEIAVAINISPVSAVSPRFWEDNEKHLAPHNPEHIIWEILEKHDQSRINEAAGHHDIDALRQQKDKGYRFALDDYLSPIEGESPHTTYALHQIRLGFFSPILDIVKFDGSMIRRALADNEAMIALREEASRLMDYYPDTIIVAEHVHNFVEAQRLPQEFSIFQGRDLTLNAYINYIRSRDQAEFRQNHSTAEVETVDGDVTEIIIPS